METYELTQDDIDETERGPVGWYEEYWVRFFGIFHELTK